MAFLNFLTSGAEARARNAQHHVVIVGGGFAGLHAAHRLGRHGFRVTLLDKRNFQLFQPLLYQVATGALTIGDIAYPQRGLLQKLKSVRTLNSTVYDLDVAQKRIHHEYGALRYDTLVVATGVKHNYFGNDHWREFAPGLKTAEHAIEMRRRIFRAFERAELTNDANARQRLLTFVVVGGGPTGVELAGALGELAHKTMVEDFRAFDPHDTRVVLVEGGPDILPTYPEKLRRKSAGHLEALGVSVERGAMVVDVNAQGVQVSRGKETESIEAATVLWAAGVRPSLFGEVVAQQTRAERDPGGRMLVGPDCALPEHPEIYVIGDLAAMNDAHGKAVPGLAPAAIQQGRFVADNLARRSAGKQEKPFVYRDWGVMAVIGMNRAVGDFRGWKMSGMLAWFIWAFVHIRALVDAEQRLRVFVNWAWKYLTRRTGDRLITGNPVHTAGLRQQRLQSVSSDASEAPRTRSA